MHHHHPLTIPLLCAFWQGAYYTQPVYAAQPHVIHHTTVVQPNSIPSTALYPAPVPVPAPRNNGMAAMGMVAGTTMAMSAGTVSKSCSLVSPYVRGLPKTVMIAFLETTGSVQLQTVREECLGWVALGTYRKTCLDRFLTLVVPNPFFLPTGVITSVFIQFKTEETSLIRGETSSRNQDWETKTTDRLFTLLRWSAAMFWTLQSAWDNRSDNQIMKP